MGVKITIAITQNSQSVANNTSNVTVKVNATWDHGSYNQLQKSGWVKIDGKTYDFTSSFNYGQSTSGTQTLHTRTVDVQHGSDGQKTLACSASYTSGVSSGTVTASASKVLTTIPRKSTLSASNGTLGNSLALTVTKQATSFTHTVTYKCGTAEGTICTKSSSTSLSWTPPISLASQNTTGASVSVTFTITTYNGSTSVGSDTKTITCAIPSSVKPSCTITLTEDGTNHISTYGGAIQGITKFRVSVSATPSYGAAIKSYNVRADGSTYTASSFTTGALKNAATMSAEATVTDARGRTSAKATASQAAFAYSRPAITKLTVHRCDSDGTTNERGDYIKVVFSYTVTSLSSKNTCNPVLKYKKTSDGTYTPVSLSNLANVFSATDQTAVFSADSGSSYDVMLEVADSFDKAARTTSASTAFTLMHWNSEGTGMAVGKVSEIPGVFDVGMTTRHFGGLLPVILEAETDLNEVLTPNTYTGANISHHNYANCPVASGTFTLLVESCGEDGQVKQTYTSCSKYKPEKYSRFYYQEAWGDWFWANTDEYILYENDAGSDAAITLNAALSHFRYIEIYFTDNNNKSGGYTKVYKPEGKTVCLQISEANGTAYSRQTLYTASGTKLTPNTTSAGYYTINASASVAAYTNKNLIKIVRVIGRA